MLPTPFHNPDAAPRLVSVPVPEPAAGREQDAFPPRGWAPAGGITREISQTGQPASVNARWHGVAPYRRLMVPQADRPQVADLWRRFVATGSIDSSAEVPVVVDHFGDSPALADELLDLVVRGQKRATAAALVEYEREASPLPAPGGMWIATDGAGRARAVLRTTEVRIGPLSSVDDGFAWDEGEGDRTRTWWLEAHEGFLRRHLPTIGVAFDPELPMVFERFELLFAG